MPLDLKQGAAALAVLPIAFVAWTAFAPGYVSRGLTEDVKLSVLGRPFVSRITCDGDRQASMLELATGQGPNQYRIRALDRADAEHALTQAFPGCKIGYPRSEGKPGWRKIIGV